MLHIWKVNCTYASSIYNWILIGTVFDFFKSIFQECDLHRSIYECQAFAFSTRTTFDNCLLSNTYGRSLDTLLETSYGWEVWTYGGVIFPNSNGGPISSSLQKVDYFSVSGRECLGERIMDPKARYWYCKTGMYLFFYIWVVEFLNLRWIYLVTFQN